ncbi:MAG TPA: c-type cytochrome, partial [Chitinophaga sp.]
MKQMPGYLPLLSIMYLLSLAFTQQPPADLKASMARGKTLYGTYCQSCHGNQGQGVEGVFPPLAKSDYLMADRKR